MKIAFYVESEAYRWMADAAIASARRHMPWAGIVHMTDERFAPLSGADIVLRAPAEGRSFLGRWRGEACRLEGDILFADCDVLFKGSVEHVFEQEFDLALPHIASPSVRYDGAIVFSRSPAFWNAFREMPVCFGASAPVDAQLAAINGAISAFAGRKRVLPGNVYSYVPRREGDECAGALIVHYRGPRKEWMKADGVQFKGAYREGRELTHPGLGHGPR